MTALTDFLTQVRSTINRTDLSDTVVTSFVRMAEERFNNELRCREMIIRSQMLMTDQVITLPVDWLEREYFRYLPQEPPVPPSDGSIFGGSDVYNYDIEYGRPIHFCTDDEYAAIQADPYNPSHYRTYYTVIGNQLFLNPAPDPVNGVQVELGYIGMIPPLDAVNAIYTRYPSLYLNATLVFSAPYIADDERLQVWAAQATASIQAINDAYIKAKYGNGPLHVRMRSFG